MEFSFNVTAKWIKWTVLQFSAAKGHWYFNSIRALTRFKDYYYSYYLLIRRTMAKHEVNYSCFRTSCLEVGKLWPVIRIRPTCCLWEYIFIGTQPGLFVYILPVAALGLEWQKWVILTENLWPTKPHMLTSRPLQKKFATYYLSYIFPLKNNYLSI